VFRYNISGLPIITSSRRRDAKNGGPEVESSKTRFAPPFDLLKLRDFGLSNLDLPLERGLSDSNRHDAYEEFSMAEDVIPTGLGILNDAARQGARMF
jgi:hypothetical protein